MKLLFFALITFLFTGIENQDVKRNSIPNYRVCVWINDEFGGQFMWDEWAQCTYNIYNCCVCPLISCTAGDCATARACALAACHLCCHPPS